MKEDKSIEIRHDHGDCERNPSGLPPGAVIGIKCYQARRLQGTHRQAEGGLNMLPSKKREKNDIGQGG
jgi:hypothetical protein